MKRVSKTSRHAFGPVREQIAFCCVADDKIKYLLQAVRWAQSIRWFGGSLAEAPLFVGLTGESPDYYGREFDRLGVISIQVDRRSEWHGPSNKLSILSHPQLEDFNTVVLMDCDVVIVGDVREYVDGDRVRAKPADSATLDDTVLIPLFCAAGKEIPSRRITTSIDEREILTYCNTGVVVLPRDTRKAFVARWIHWNEFVLANSQLLGKRTFFSDQASFSLALAEFLPRFDELPIEMNFPCHLAPERYPTNLHFISPLVLHYHDRIDGRSGTIQKMTLPGPDGVIERFNDRVRAERRRHFAGAIFWDDRYLNDPKRGSGIGSRGKHALYKADLIRQFLAARGPGRLIDFGCGDCSILEYLNVSDYIGIDASREVIVKNEARFPRKCFLCAELPHANAHGELSLCLDVLIHQQSRESFDAVLDSVIGSTAKAGLVNGFDEDPRLQSDIVFFHVSLREALAALGVKFEAVGGYRKTTIYSWSKQNSAA